MERKTAEEVIREYYKTVYRWLLPGGQTGGCRGGHTGGIFTFLHKAPEFTSEEHCKAWLLRVTVNYCNSLLRSAWRRKVGELTEEIPFEETEDLLLYRELQNYRRNTGRSFIYFIMKKCRWHRSQTCFIGRNPRYGHN